MPGAGTTARPTQHLGAARLDPIPGSNAPGSGPPAVAQLVDDAKPESCAVGDIGRAQPLREVAAILDRDAEVAILAADGERDHVAPSQAAVHKRVRDQLRYHELDVREHIPGHSAEPGHNATSRSNGRHLRGKIDTHLNHLYPVLAIHSEPESVVNAGHIRPSREYPARQAASSTITVLRRQCRGMRVRAAGGDSAPVRGDPNPPGFADRSRADEACRPLPC